MCATWNAHLILLDFREQYRYSWSKQRKRIMRFGTWNHQEVQCGDMDWTNLLRIGTSGGLFKRGNEPLSSVNCGEFLD
jgi:hypothetical protein